MILTAQPRVTAPPPRENKMRPCDKCKTLTKSHQVGEKMVPVRLMGKVVLWPEPIVRCHRCWVKDPVEWPPPLVVPKPTEKVEEEI